MNQHQALGVLRVLRQIRWTLTTPRDREDMGAKGMSINIGRRVAVVSTPLSMPACVLLDAHCAPAVFPLCALDVLCLCFDV